MFSPASLQNMVIQRVHTDENGSVRIAITHDRERNHGGERYHGCDEHVPEVILFSDQRGAVLDTLVGAEEPVAGRAGRRVHDVRRE